MPKTQLKTKEKPWYDATYYEKYLLLIQRVWWMALITVAAIHALFYIEGLSEMTRMVIIGLLVITNIVDGALMMSRKGMSFKFSGAGYSAEISSEAETAPEAEVKV